jgi:hypothetical protein
MIVAQSSTCLGWPSGTGDPGQSEATIVELVLADDVATVVSRGDDDGDYGCSGLSAMHDAVDVAVTQHKEARLNVRGVALADPGVPRVLSSAGERATSDWLVVGARSPGPASLVRAAGLISGCIVAPRASTAPSGLTREACGPHVGGPIAAAAGTGEPPHLPRAVAVADSSSSRRWVAP